MVLHFYLSAGSDYTSGTLATSWASITNANRVAGQTVDLEHLLPVMHFT